MTVGYDHVIALDVGGATLKASCIPMTPSTDDSLSNPSHIKTTEAPYLLANHVATLTSSTTMLMGADLIAKERQRGKLHYIRPIERGYCVNWNIETEIWNHLFSSKMMNTRSNLSTQALVATAPLFSPTVLLETMDQVVFEEFGWNAFVRVNSAEMSVLSYADHCQQQENDIPLVEDSWRGFHRSSCHLVIDSGFSFTHVIPVIQHCVYLPGVKRMNVGGKLLTNYLKEVVSFRQWNVMEETIVINELKEQLCYCSLDFNTEIKRYHTERTSRKHWILPDFVHSFHGKILDQNIHKEHEQTLEMGVEMISVPEILFHPSDIGLDQAGLAEVIMQSILKCPEEYHASLLDNILLVGGNIQFPNFKQRLYQGLRPLVPDDFSISIHCAPDPILAAWKGCTLFGSNQETMSSRVVTKQEYEEYGSNICRKRFR